MIKVWFSNRSSMYAHVQPTELRFLRLMSDAGKARVYLKGTTDDREHAVSVDEIDMECTLEPYKAKPRHPTQ